MTDEKKRHRELILNILTAIGAMFLLSFVVGAVYLMGMSNG